MNWVDIFLVAIILFAAWTGWHRGFIIGTLDLVTWIASMILGYIYYPYAVRVIERFFDAGAWLLPLGFISTFLLARILLGFIKLFIIRAIPSHVNEGTPNKLFGLIPGTVTGLIFAVIFSALLLSLPLKDGVTSETRTSKFAGTLAMQSEWANKKLAVVFDEAVRQTMNSLTVKPSSNDRIPLPFTYDNPKPRPDLEAKMLVLINRDRAKENLPPLAADPEMTRVARLHSKDMFARGYFAHVNPDEKTPFDRMTALGVSYKRAGENLALAQTMEIAHNNLMNSPGHYANLMHTGFGRVGIGVMDGGFYGLMISQEFRD